MHAARVPAYVLRSPRIRADRTTGSVLFPFGLSDTRTMARTATHIARPLQVVPAESRRSIGEPLPDRESPAARPSAPASKARAAKAGRYSRPMQPILP